MNKTQERDQQEPPISYHNPPANNLGASSSPFTPSQEQTDSSFPSKHRYKILNVFIVICALACLTLTFLLLISAVSYFSSIFSATDEFTAKHYINQNQKSVLAAVYLSIMGAVILITNTIVNFTSFTQKQGMVCLHTCFYIVFVVCGAVAVVNSSALQSQNYSSVSQQECEESDYKCWSYANLVQINSRLRACLIGYCICFLVFTVLFHLTAYWQRKQRQAEIHIPITISTIALEKSQIIKDMLGKAKNFAQQYE